MYFDVNAGGSNQSDFIQGLIQNYTNGSTVNGTYMWEASQVLLQTILGRVDKTKMFNYMGSLTTPGCSEVVEWVVINDPQNISPTQLQFFTSMWAGNSTFAGGFGNNRMVQAIGNRTIYYYPGINGGNSLANTNGTSSTGSKAILLMASVFTAFMALIAFF